MRKKSSCVGSDVEEGRIFCVREIALWEEILGTVGGDRGLTKRRGEKSTNFW